MVLALVDATIVPTGVYDVGINRIVCESMDLPCNPRSDRCRRTHRAIGQEYREYDGES